MTRVFEQNVGSTTDWNGELYGELFSSSPFSGSNPLDELQVGAGDRVLDFGCGTGELTARISHLGASVVGIDPSPEMISVAREQFPALDFRVAEIEEFDPDGQFDSVFSNDVLHWIEEPLETLEQIRELLAADGRFVAEFAAEDNVRRIRKQLHELLRELGYSPEELDPWNFASRSQYEKLLDAAGFHVEETEYFSQPANLPGENGLRLWLDLFAGQLLDPLTTEERQQVIQKLEDRLAPDCFLGDEWLLEYRRLKITAAKNKPSLITI